MDGVLATVMLLTNQVCAYVKKGKWVYVRNACKIKKFKFR